MNVLSLFNGMNTGRQALENVGVKVNKYYSSEIKPYAIELTQHHFSDTIQLGDINNWKSWNIDYSKIDLILSGSPCQDLSIAGNRAGLNGSKSSLFWVFIDILNHVKKLNPNVLFLQENVGSASKKDIGTMSIALGLYPVRINSKLLTAQLRDRYYWTNIKTRTSLFDIITDIPQPRDKKIYLKDIIENGFTYRKKSRAILERYYSDKYKDEFSEKAQRYYNKRMNVGGFTTYIETSNNLLRAFTQIELERLQGFSDGYTSILSYNHAASLLGDGWTLPVIEHIFSYL